MRSEAEPAERKYSKQVTKSSEHAVSSGLEHSLSISLCEPLTLGLQPKVRPVPVGRYFEPRTAGRLWGRLRAEMLGGSSVSQGICNKVLVNLRLLVLSVGILSAQENWIEFIILAKAIN
jgi:hypothetical protein